MSKSRKDTPDLFTLAGLDEEDKIELKRNELKRSISAAKLDNVQERVAWILNHYPDTRDSDITLQIKYWEAFEHSLAGGETIRKDDLYQLTRLVTLTRARAKIQNTYGLFQASPEIQKHRGMLSEEELSKAREQQTSHPIFDVYADESGKNSRVLLVGSLWFLYPPNILTFVRGLSDFKAQHNFKYEFHFKQINPRTLDMYIDLADWIFANSAVMSFKAVSVERAGLRSVAGALEVLFYHLLVRGVEHEHESARAPLPRGIQLSKDLEEIGSDKLLLAELGDRLRNASASRFNGELFVGEMEAVDSKEHLPMQIADLYVGCLHRILNSEGGKPGPKDQFARYLLDRLGLPGPLNQEMEGDLAIHVSL